MDLINCHHPHQWRRRRKREEYDDHLTVDLEHRLVEVKMVQVRRREELVNDRVHEVPEFKLQQRIQPRPVERQIDAEPLENRSDVGCKLQEMLHPSQIIPIKCQGSRQGGGTLDDMGGSHDEQNRIREAGLDEGPVIRE